MMIRLIIFPAIAVCVEERGGNLADWLTNGRLGALTLRVERLRDIQGGGGANAKLRSAGLPRCGLEGANDRKLC